MAVKTASPWTLIPSSNTSRVPAVGGTHTGTAQSVYGGRIVVLLTRQNGESDVGVQLVAAVAADEGFVWREGGVHGL